MTVWVCLKISGGNSWTWKIYPKSNKMRFFGFDLVLVLSPYTPSFSDYLPFSVEYIYFWLITNIEHQIHIFD